MSNVGGYEDGYRQCKNFWGQEPSRLVKNFAETSINIANMCILDCGCGEGKNAAYLASLGAQVRAVDISPLALKNAVTTWQNAEVSWENGDARLMSFSEGAYDAVIMYGLLHCFLDSNEVTDFVSKLKSATKIQGYHVLCAYNDRFQPDLSMAHPGFYPCLLSHFFYSELYSDWEIIQSSDEDLYETHPHNGIPHVHSMTRILTRRIK